MKQLAAFFDGHYRKLTVGAANQQAVIAQINHAFDIFTQRRKSIAPLAVNGVTVMLKMPRRRSRHSLISFIFLSLQQR